MASVNQARPNCVNQMGKTRSRTLAVWRGRGTAWEQHAVCESAFKGYEWGSSNQIKSSQFSYLLIYLFVSEV
jgi:hypothetical protein